MKNLVKYFLILVAIAAIIAIIYWENNKKQIIKGAIQTTVKQKTDSIYSIHYDSSEIDEINGNATFYNVRMQSDSLQKQLLQSADSLPAVIFNIHVNEVGARGVNVAGLLSNQLISARVIYLMNPVVQIIKTGSDRAGSLTAADTLALYEEILGKFTSIKADTILVINGEVSINDRDGNTLTSFKKVNIGLNNFIIDSSHDYSNIVSYFVKDVKASVEEIKLPGDKPTTKIILNNVEYDAAKKTLAVQHIRQYDSTNGRSPIDINKIAVDGLNTNAFIIMHQLKANNITCDGGVLTIFIYGKPAAKKGDPILTLSDDFFDQAHVSGINISNTTVIIANRQKPGDEPVELNNVKFNVLKGVNISDGSTLSDIINNARWQLSSDGFGFNSKNGDYKITIGNFTVTNDSEASIKLSGIHLKPIISETAYGKKYMQQKDLYNFDFNNIVMKGFDFKKLVSENKIEMQDMYVQPLVRIFNDRTLPSDDTSNRVGTYPHQSLLKLKLPFYIKTIHINNGFVSYREKGSSTALVGELTFNNINGQITNITNIHGKIDSNSLCVLNVKALFLNKAHFSTKWQLPLNTVNGSFIVSGRLDSMDGTILNPVIKPLGLMSLKQGHIDELTFNVDGNDDRTITDVSLLYKNLEMNILKKTEDKNGVDSLKKKGLASFVANVIILNNNPENGQTRKIDKQEFKRDIHRPFFYMVWTSIFMAAKKTVMGQKSK